MSPSDVVDIDPAEEMAANAIDPSEAKAETAGTSTEPPAELKTDEVIDIIQPKSEPKTWHLSDGDDADAVRRDYIQRPLSYFGKIQFFSLVGDVIDKAVSGENGLRISSLFEAPAGQGGQLSAADFREADTFIQAVGKLLNHAPDFMEKSYCIWLGIPDYEREWAITVMNMPPPHGLSDDDGIEIIEIFIDQNWESLEGFFRERFPQLRNRVQARRKESSDE